MTNENTPYIGENGNWYINGEDTGMRSQGEEGPQGPVGPQGLIGPKGITGNRGPQGVKGDTPELAANLSTTLSGKALDATMGKVLDDKIATNTNSIDVLSQNLGDLIRVVKSKVVTDTLAAKEPIQLISNYTLPAGYTPIMATAVVEDWFVTATINGFNNSLVNLAIVNNYGTEQTVRAYADILCVKKFA